ncbi:telomerase reverse transcriptase-like [Venturia canescens]|uniref:telomerase reverse transcriptase-like n=1 Tax=Venturia canescens TaxID=32260 RepID=UPI001C9D5D1A|nr:telomerase reverse transcriptase-like [Venturia canescens]XP_043275146.1 telomerase reverse transcriptase-like [Venturia canescens]XP_043275147.1 telomerase reverse transcriptase-like [Venturia canescens]XP_043275148.1 telomerase reverse transcriptase-like [Venturia canescens]
MMKDQVRWSMIESRYGDPVVRYLKDEDVQLNKLAPNVYMVSNVNILKQCAKIVPISYDECSSSGEPSKKKQKINHSPVSQIESNCYDFPENLKRIVNIDFEKSPPKKDMSEVQVKNLSVEVNLLICLDLLYTQKDRMPELSFLSSKNLRPSWDHEKVFHCMMETHVGRQKETKYSACFKELKPILENFHKRHKKFNHVSCLETVMTETNSSENNDHNVSINQLQKYFYLVTACVIPKQLFGNNRNLKKLRQGLKKYFLSSWKENLSLKSYVTGMNISCIRWLKSIPDVETQWLIIAKIARWLFEVYFLGILKTVFRVQKDLYSEKKVFLSSARWKKRTCQYVKTLKRKKAIEEKGPVVESLQNELIICNIHPKKYGVRCVYSLPKGIRDEVMMLKAFLQQLYSQENELSSVQRLYPEWLNLVEKKQQDPDHPYFLVSSDITDAYGSVIQTKLYEIVHEMIMKIPDDRIALEWLAVLKPNVSDMKNEVEYIQWCSYCSSLPQIPAHSLVSRVEDDEHTRKFIFKEDMCLLLKKYILQQNFSYRGTNYSLKKGLPQGFPLSSVLSDIYYGHMMREDFAITRNSGLLARYVDDFLYVTDKKDAAKEFMEKIRQGVPEYHCRFSISKTRTNLISCRWESTEDVSYLGHRIDCATLQVSPVFTDVDFRHNKSMQCVKYKNEQQAFVMRLRNFAALKLSPIVLDAKINSFEVICSTVESAAYTMASRSAVLISRVYPKCERYAYEIWVEIRKAVKLVMRNLFSFLFKSGNRLGVDKIRRIEKLIWKSYRKVFAKNANLHKCFGNSIRGEIINRLT